MRIMYVILIVPPTNRTRSVHIPEQIPRNPGQQVIVLMLCNDALNIFLPIVCISRFHILKAIDNIGVNRIEFHFCHIHSPLPKILTSKDSTLFIGQTSDAIPVGAIQLFAILAICIIALLLCKEFLCGFQVTKIMTLIPCVGIRVKMPRHNVGLIVILLVKQCRIGIAHFQDINIFSVHYSSPFESCNRGHLPSVLLVLHPCCCWMKCKVCHAVLAAFHRVLYISILCRTYR
nr:MAG TPA: hypothetical protein [Bacteriophage sp.]